MSEIILILGLYFITGGIFSLILISKLYHAKIDPIYSADKKLWTVAWIYHAATWPGLFREMINNHVERQSCVDQLHSIKSELDKIRVVDDGGAE